MAASGQESDTQADNSCKQGNTKHGTDFGPSSAQDAGKLLWGSMMPDTWPYCGPKPNSKLGWPLFSSLMDHSHLHLPALLPNGIWLGPSAHHGQLGLATELSYSVLCRHGTEPPLRDLRLGRLGTASQEGATGQKIGRWLPTGPSGDLAPDPRSRYGITGRRRPRHRLNAYNILHSHVS